MNLAEKQTRNLTLFSLAFTGTAGRLSRSADIENDSINSAARAIPSIHASMIEEQSNLLAALRGRGRNQVAHVAHDEQIARIR